MELSLFPACTTPIQSVLQPDIAHFRNAGACNLHFSPRKKVSYYSIFCDVQGQRDMDLIACSVQFAFDPTLIALTL